MCDCQGQLLTRAREANAEALVSHGISAAASQVAYARALSSSRRAQALLGEGAGGERAWEAEQHFRARTASLQHLAEAVEELRRSAEPGQVSLANERIARGAVREFVADARHSVLSALLESDISADHARDALAALDQRSADLESIGSFEQLTQLLKTHVEDLGATPYGQAALDSGLCILILLLSSLLVVLALIAAIICIATLGFGCQDIFNQLVAQACSGGTTG